MNQEAIALLKAMVFDEGLVYSRENREKRDQALAILKQPKAQPSSEFTKDLRDLLEIPNDESVKDIAYIDNLETLVRMCCDRLDTSEASRKELLTACKGLMEKADNGSADFDDPEPGSIYLKAIAAIAKAGT